MKNVVYNVKVKWTGALEGTALAATMADRGGTIRDIDEQVGEGIAETEDDTE